KVTWFVMKAPLVAGGLVALAVLSWAAVPGTAAEKDGRRPLLLLGLRAQADDPDLLSQASEAAHQGGQGGGRGGGWVGLGGEDHERVSEGSWVPVHAQLTKETRSCSALTLITTLISRALGLRRAARQAVTGYPERGGAINCSG